MKNVGIDELVTMAKSWATAPKLTLMPSDNSVSNGFDLSERAYRLTLNGKQNSLKVSFRLDASKESPLYHPAVIIENWGDQKAAIRVNGVRLTEGKEFKQGLIERLDGTHLVIWINRIADEPVEIVISGS
jgi:hypothetical protein